MRLLTTATCVTYVRKDFLITSLTRRILTKYQISTKFASNFTYLCTSKFIKYNLTDTDHLLLKSKFYGQGQIRNVLLHFWQLPARNSSHTHAICISTFTSILHYPLHTPPLQLHTYNPWLTCAGAVIRHNPTIYSKHTTLSQ